MSLTDLFPSFDWGFPACVAGLKNFRHVLRSFLATPCRCNFLVMFPVCRLYQKPLSELRDVLTTGRLFDGINQNIKK